MFSSIIAYNTLTPEQKTEVLFGAAFNHESSAGGVVGMVARDFREAAWPTETVSTPPAPDSNTGGGGGLLIIGAIIALFVFSGHQPDQGSNVSTGTAITRSTAPSREANLAKEGPTPTTIADINKLTEVVKNPQTKLFIGENFSIRQSAELASPVLGRSRLGGLARDLGETATGWRKVSYFSAAGNPVANGFVSPEEWNKIVLLSVPLGKSDKSVTAYVQQNDSTAPLSISQGNRTVAYLNTGETVEILKRSKISGSVVIRARTDQGPVTGEVPAAWLTTEKPTFVQAPVQVQTAAQQNARPNYNRTSYYGSYYPVGRPVAYSGRDSSLIPAILLDEPKRSGGPDFGALLDDAPPRTVSNTSRSKLNRN